MPRNHGKLVQAPRLTRREQAIVTEVSQRIRYEMLSAVAADPTASFPRGSYAAITQRYVKRQRPEVQTKARSNARALFGASVAERRWSCNSMKFASGIYFLCRFYVWSIISGFGTHA